MNFKENKKRIFIELAFTCYIYLIIHGRLISTSSVSPMSKHKLIIRWSLFIQKLWLLQKNLTIYIWWIQTLNSIKQYKFEDSRN